MGLPVVRTSVVELPAVSDSIVCEALRPPLTELLLVEQLFGDRGLTVDLAVIESSVLEHTVVGQILLHSGETVGFAVVEALVHSGMTVGSAVVGLTSL